MTVSDNSLKQNISFLKSTFRKSIFPSMLSILSANINVFVDGILVGNKLGTNALAAINLSLPLYLIMCIIGSFFSSGTAISSARAIGDNDPEKSQMYYRSCVVSMFFISIIMTVIGLFFREPLVSFLCSNPDIRPYVKEYVVITLIGTLPKIMLYIPFWYLRLDGKNNSVAIVMAIMSVGNIILDFLFVYLWDMGVFGAGLASVISTTIAFIIGMIMLAGKNCFFSFKPFIFKDRKEWKVIAVTGTPSALNNLLSTFRLLLINSVLLQYGGANLVAVFTAVNGIAGFGECITLGIPQAASPMLGVFSGEQDTGSCSLLVRLELITGCVFSAVFLALTLVLSDLIRDLYCLSDSLFFPLFWLGLSIFPAMLCTIISGYYNTARKNIWSNCIILFRVIIMTYIGLVYVTKFRISTFSFLFFAEASTALFWFIATCFYHPRHPSETRFLMMDTTLEEAGNILNFSVSSDSESICSASERISAFCESNGMDMKTTMRIELAMEEIMTLIASVNKDKFPHPLNFDLRAYSLQGLSGIRIRYDGIEFNPFKNSSDGDEMYMGIEMLKKMVRSQYQRTFGVNTLQIVMRMHRQQKQ